MPKQSKSIQAIKLTRTIFEHIHGNLGLLKFNIEELKPINGPDEEESEKWEIICSFYETLGSSAPSRYKVTVNLKDRSATLLKVSGDKSSAQEEKFKVVEEEGSQSKTKSEPEPKQKPEEPRSEEGKSKDETETRSEPEPESKPEFEE